jgi:hypothetical protein
MMLLLLLAATAAAAASPQTPAKMADPAVVAAGLNVELVVPPRPMSGHDFSIKLAAATGIMPRTPGDPIDDGRRTRYGAGAASVWGKDGRSVVIYYQPEANLDPRKTKVCRILANRVAPFEARWPAIRWCHARLGYATPATPPPLD